MRSYVVQNKTSEGLRPKEIAEFAENYEEGHQNRKPMKPENGAAGKEGAECDGKMGIRQ